MKLKHKLAREFDFHTSDIPASSHADIEQYANIAKGYALMENTIAVLSDLTNHSSIVIHSKFSETIDIDISKCNGTIPSIWEDEIFQAIHPDDYEAKMLQELLFFHYVNNLPREKRFDQCLMQKLRVRNRNGEWIEMLHRLHYIPSSDGKVCLAMCLYGAMVTPLGSTTIVVDTLTGKSSILDQATGNHILSRQETIVLGKIDSGYKSSEIADELKISIHTVNRHRQNIIAKLKVRNSTEACKIARTLNII